MQGAIEALTYIARNPCSSDDDVRSGIYQYAANILATEGEMQYRRTAELNQKQRQADAARTNWDMQNMMKNSEYAHMRGQLFESDDPYSQSQTDVAGMSTGMRAGMSAGPGGRMPMREMVGDPRMRNHGSFDMNATSTAADMGIGTSMNADADIPLNNIRAGSSSNIYANSMRADSGISAHRIPQGYPSIASGAQPVMNYPPIRAPEASPDPSARVSRVSHVSPISKAHSSENMDENGIPIF